MTENLTFEQLPEAVTILTKEVGELKRLLLEKKDHQNLNETEKLLDVEGAAKFLNLTAPTIYSKVSRNELPYMKKSKRLYFSSVELMNYLKDGKNKTNLEIEQEAENYLMNKRKGSNYGK